MSLHDQARELIDKAEVAIRADNPQYAMELLRQSILYNGKDADGYLLLGICLAQMKMPADAENAFKKATSLAPDSVKARYNLAVHQYSQGQTQAALNNARKAAEIDVRHAGSKDLVSRIEEELGLSAGEEPKITPAGNPTPLTYDSSYDVGSVRAVPLVERLGPFWTLIGWSIALVSFAGIVLMISILMPVFQSGKGFDNALTVVAANRWGATCQAMGWGANVLAILWIAMDAINRRGNLLWLLPQAICGCTGFTWIILPLYMFVGRNNEKQADNEAISES